MSPESRSDDCRRLPREYDQGEMAGCRRGQVLHPVFNGSSDLIWSARFRHARGAA